MVLCAGGSCFGFGVRLVAAARPELFCFEYAPLRGAFFVMGFVHAPPVAESQRVGAWCDVRHQKQSLRNLIPPVLVDRSARWPASATSMPPPGSSLSWDKTLFACL